MKLTRVRWLVGAGAVALIVAAVLVQGAREASPGGAAGGSSRGGAGGGGGASGGGARAVFPVEVSPVSTRNVEYTVSAVGSVEAFEVVQVTARVPGAVEKLHFTEGRRVRAGDVLVEIEPARYELEVATARAALEKAEAAQAEADAGLARRTAAVEKNPGLIPGEEMAMWRTRVRTAVAEVASARASLEQAEMDARNARPRAPFGGTIQTRDVRTGQYVQPGALLTTLVRREPLLLRFQVPELDAARIEPGMPARFTTRDTERTFTAKITHVAETASEASRMIAITARIDDPERESLRPGSFAEVTVPVGSSGTAAVIPQTAVRPTERGFIAFVIEEGVAAERALTLGLRTQDGLVEVKSGLAPGESLVVRGAEALRTGAAVRVEAPATAAAAAVDSAASAKSAPGSAPPAAGATASPASRKSP